MRDYKRYIIHQQLDILRGLKNNKRKHKLKKRKSRVVSKENTTTPRAPRHFRRTNIHLVTNPNHLLSKNWTNIKDGLIGKHMPTNLKYLLSEPESPFYLKKIKKEKFNSAGKITMPSEFSILDNADESYDILKKIISALLIEDTARITLDYKNCKKIELSSQILLDIILRDFWIFRTICKNTDRNKRDFFPSGFGGINIDDSDIQKLLFSVGSASILKVREIEFEDIIPYKLCVHDNEQEKNYLKKTEQKEIDTTEMADYVIACLKRMNKKLTKEKLNDLCTVIGEILINAEEHSTTKYRFSIGYFKEENQNGKHYGLFRLVILNFGKTIYQKFKSDDCPNKDIVDRMKELSEKYTNKKWFFQSKFEEENLWTLYALQEGVTSIPYDKYKRGNGSIRFIESFFNIKGSKELDDTSRLSIISGKTRILFDGKYNIDTKVNQNKDTFKVMTFNESGEIEDKPDNKYVYCTNNYFPGTCISARILLNDDDIKQLNN